MVSRAPFENGELMPSIRVLVVDDSVFVREALTEARCSGPMIEIVGTAANGEQALSLIPTLKPNLIMLDLSLPGVSGSATLAAIRRKSPDTSVILLAPFGEP